MQRGQLIDVGGALGVFSHREDDTAYYWSAREAGGEIYINKRGRLTAHVNLCHPMPTPAEIRDAAAVEKEISIARMRAGQNGKAGIKTITTNRSRKSLKMI